MSAANGIPYNPQTGRDYTRGNVPILSMAAIDLRWAGYNQWLELGYVVNPGEKATKITLVSEYKEKQTGKDKRSVRSVPIFNFAQVALNAELASSKLAEKLARRAAKVAA